MMKCILTATLSLILGNSFLGAQNAAKDENNGEKKNREKRVDLNKVDFEQLEGDWESTPKNPSFDLGRSPKLKDIMEPSSEYSYASFGRPDPFRQPEISITAPPAPEQPIVGGESVVAKSKLQLYPLQDLTVKGFWQLEDGQTRAMVVTPKGEGEVIRAGDPIASGKVLKIDSKEVKVRLYRIRADGVREYDDVAITIGGQRQQNQGMIKYEPGKDPVFLKNEEGVGKPQVLPKAAPMVQQPAPAAQAPAAQAVAQPAPAAPAKNAAPANANRPPANQADVMQQMLQGFMPAKEAAPPPAPSSGRPGAAR